jgi:DNA-binding NarL/FixJ family response regulator
MSMIETLVDSQVSLERIALERRIAVGLEDVDTREAVVSLLAAGGLPVNAGALAIAEIGRVVADPPDALVLVGDALDAEVLAAVRRVRRDASATRIVVVAADRGAASQQARQALNAGADAFVPHGAAAHSLAPAVHAVLAGLVCIPRDTRRVLAKPTFSHREKEVLGLLVAGLTNREIASRLFLAESTVKTHLVSAFGKLGVRSRKDAAAVLLDPAEGLGAVALVTNPRQLRLERD